MRVAERVDAGVGEIGFEVVVAQNAPESGQDGDFIHSERAAVGMGTKVGPFIVRCRMQPYALAIQIDARYILLVAGLAAKTLHCLLQGGLITRL